MSGDYSRIKFDVHRDLTGVLMQQGRVALDADWNELVDIIERRFRTQTVDIIGRAIVPLETPDGFEISFNGKEMQIGRGRMYVDGHLIENHGSEYGSIAYRLDRHDFDPPTPATDLPAGVLDELIGQGIVPYSKQPYWPNPVDLSNITDRHLVYAVCWRREITWTEAPEDMEPALNGVDTTARYQYVWQVRVFPPADKDGFQNLACGTPDADITDWSKLIAPSAGRLSTDTVPPSDPEDPCLLPPDGGYRRLENQLYRIEIHDGGKLGAATFKWSRENASVTAAGLEISGDRKRLTVNRIGRDDVLTFEAGDWVEVTDDRREFNQLPGFMHQIKDIHPETRELEFENNLDPSLGTPNDKDDSAARHLRVRRWDQKGDVLDEDGNVIGNVDASNGLITIPSSGAVQLEGGIVVRFDLVPNDGRLLPMDYWTFAARTATTEIEKLVHAPPRGIYRHYARLAVIENHKVIDDCREFWPPAIPTTTGEGCACSACVTPESHNSGDLTIQQAIEEVQESGGGIVCLEIGIYHTGQPIIIDSATSVTVRGRGYETVINYSGNDAALIISNSAEIMVEELKLEAAKAVAAIRLQNIIVKLTLRNCFISAFLQGSTAIEAWGVLWSALIEDNVIQAPYGLRNVAIFGDDSKPYLATLDTRVENNFILSTSGGLDFGDVAVHLGDLRIVANTILAGAQGGIIVNGVGFNGRAEIHDNLLVVSEGTAISGSASPMRIGNNDLYGMNSRGGAITLDDNPWLPQKFEGQVTANRMRSFSAHGIYAKGQIHMLTIKQNQIQQIRGPGIAVSAGPTSLSIENNQIADLKTSEASSIAGILVSATGQTLIAQNVINGVTNASSQNNAESIGIDAAGASLNISGNSVSNITHANQLQGVRGAYRINPLLSSFMTAADDFPFGPTGDAILVTGASIFVTNAFGQNYVTISHNSASNESEGDWFGMKIGSRDGFVPVFDLTPPPLDIVISGNNIQDIQNIQSIANIPAGTSKVPAVEVIAPNGSCIFTDNICTTVSDIASVKLEVSRLVASNNILKGIPGTNKPTMELFGPSSTIIGNVTYGPIYLNGSPITAPFKALNIAH